jgi:hypothetical protein
VQNYFAATLTVAIVCPFAELTSENGSPSLTQLPVPIVPLEGRAEANSTPDTWICSALYPGAFQLSVVVPTLPPAANTIGFGFAVNVT